MTTVQGYLLGGVPLYVVLVHLIFSTFLTLFTFFLSSVCLLNLVLKNAPAKVQIMILGNKCDLDDARVVSTERGQLVSA